MATRGEIINIYTTYTHISFTLNTQKLVKTSLWKPKITLPKLIFYSTTVRGTKSIDLLDRCLAHSLVIVNE